MKEMASSPSLNPCNLDGEFYVQSLLAEGCRTRMLTEADVSIFQNRCVEFLAQKSKLYTSGDSSSIKIELAQNILESILYTIGVPLKAKEPSSAIALLKSSSIHELYSAGRKKIEIKRRTAKHLHTLVLKTLVRTANETYTSTLVDGIKGFFQLYDADYSAHEIHITADYPLSNPVTHLAGIEFIVEYLRRALYENEFCSRFDPQRIHRAMTAFHAGYQHLVINLFDQVLASSLGCILTDTDLYGLLVPRSKVIKLQSGWLLKSRKEIDTLLLDACGILFAEFGLSDESLTGYIKKSLLHVSSSVFFAIETLTLNKIFVCSG